MEAEINKLISVYNKKEKLKEDLTLLKYLIKENYRLKNLLEIKNSLNEIKVKKIKIKHNKKREEACLIALLSDIHFEHHITKSSTNNYNEYNIEIATKRLNNYFTNLLKIKQKNERDIKINTLLWGWLGDFIHGLIHEEYLRTNLLTPSEALIQLSEILVSGLNFILNNSKLENIIIVCKVGNHSRTTEKIYNDNESLFSYEWLLYNTLKNKFPQINWIIENNYISYVEINNKLIRFHHGHQIKYAGGIGGIYIPLNKYRLRIDQHIRADLNCLGHFHVSDWLRNGKTLLNGSICGYDAYALRKGFEPEKPSQQTLILDYKRGFTINTPIILE